MEIKVYRKSKMFVPTEDKEELIEKAKSYVCTLKEYDQTIPTIRYNNQKIQISEHGEVLSYSYGYPKRLNPEEIPGDVLKKLYTQLRSRAEEIEQRAAELVDKYPEVFAEAALLSDKVSSSRAGQLADAVAIKLGELNQIAARVTMPRDQGWRIEAWFYLEENKGRTIRFWVRPGERGYIWAHLTRINDKIAFIESFSKMKADLEELVNKLASGGDNQ